MSIDITVQTNIWGLVNGHALTGRVLATFNTDRGGNSTCEFSQLPPEFTPATFGTHT